MSPHQEQDMKLIDRHLAGVLTPEEVERVERLIRTSPEWAQQYREAEDLAQLMRKGLGGGAPAPDAVKQAIRRRVSEQSSESRPARSARPRTGFARSRTGTGFARSRWIVAAAAVALVAIGSAVLRSRTEPLIPMGFLDQPLALKDLARQSTVAFEATTVLHDGQVRMRPDRVLYGEVGDRAIAVPADLKAGHTIAVFGQYDGSGMIRPVEGNRGIVYLDGVQRWEGKDRQPAESRALVAQAGEQRSLAESLADLESFLSSDASEYSERAGLAFSADVTARYLGAFEFEAIVKPLVQLVLDGDKHPDSRNAAAEGLERSNPARACDMLLRSMAQQKMPNLQAESEDGQVVLGCLKLLRRSGTAQLAPTLRKLAQMMKAPALKQAAEAALAGVTSRDDRNGPWPSVSTPVRFHVDGRECIVMGGAQGKRHGLVVVFRGSENVVAFRPVVNTAIERGFGVLIVPQGVRELEACLEACEEHGLVATNSLRYFVHWSALDDARQARQSHPADALVEMTQSIPDPARSTPLTAGETLAKTPLDVFFAR